MIAVVVPTNRPETFQDFINAWDDLFQAYNIVLYKVLDGNKPEVHRFNGVWTMFTQKQIMGKYEDLICNHTDGVRNLGFSKAYQDGADIIISLDDDTRPFGDTIQDHLDALNKRVPISWMNTVEEEYMRGFPYNVREEAEVVLSHGTWVGVADFDAPTQLKIGTPEVTSTRAIVPKGILFPMCIMNVAFKRKMVPYMYQAPMGNGIDRFADIWGGIEAKKDIDKEGWAAVTGYAQVVHERASNPFTNLVKEAKGIGMNENYGKDPYFKMFHEKRKRWQNFLKK